MPCRGVHFALTPEHLAALGACANDRARLDCVREVIEPECFDSEPDALTRDHLRAGYDRIDPRDYGFPLTDEDFEYTWDWFDQLRDIWQRAAAENRAVLFTVDQ